MDLIEWADRLAKSKKSPATRRARFALLGEPVLPYGDVFGQIRYALGDLEMPAPTIMRLMGASARIVAAFDDPKNIDSLPTDFPDLLQTQWTGKGWTVAGHPVLTDGIASVRLGLRPRSCDQCGTLYAPQRKDMVHCSPSCRVAASNKR